MTEDPTPPMNPFYVIAPLLGLVAFGGFQRHHAGTYAARVAQEKHNATREKQEIERLRDEAQSTALAAATLATAQRQRDAADKTRRDEALRQAQLDAGARHTAAIGRFEHVGRQHARLREELDRAAIELASREKFAESLRLQQERVTQQIARADENRRAVERLQDELETAMLRPPAPFASAPLKRP